MQQLNKKYKIMLQDFFCFIRDKHCDCLTDGLSDERLCVLNSSDFPKLIVAGYSIEIIDFFDTEFDPELHSRFLRRSHFVTRFVIKHNKLPLIKRL